MGKILIGILAILLTCSVGFCWTYEGELNPEEFVKWKVISVVPCFSRIPHLHVKVKSPDSPLVIEMIVDIDDTLLNYFYTKNGVEYEFELDKVKDHYKQVKPESDSDFKLPPDDGKLFTREL